MQSNVEAVSNVELEIIRCIRLVSSDTRRVDSEIEGVAIKVYKMVNIIRIDLTYKGAS